MTHGRGAAGGSTFRTHPPWTGLASGRAHDDDWGAMAEVLNAAAPATAWTRSGPRREPVAASTRISRVPRRP